MEARPPYWVQGSTNGSRTSLSPRVPGGKNGRRTTMSDRQRCKNGRRVDLWSSGANHGMTSLHQQKVQEISLCTGIDH